MPKPATSVPLPLSPGSSSRISSASREAASSKASEARPISGSSPSVTYLPAGLHNAFSPRSSSISTVVTSKPPRVSEEARTPSSLPEPGVSSRCSAARSVRKCLSIVMLHLLNTRCCIVWLLRALLCKFPLRNRKKYLIFVLWNGKITIRGWADRPVCAVL